MECDFCKKKFKLPGAFANHQCVQKQREEDRELKHVRFAHQIFNRFQERIERKKAKPYEEFRKSYLYLDFIRIAKRIIDLNAVDTPRYIDYLLDSKLPIKKWVSEETYSKYLREYAKGETITEAITRNLLLMEQWGARTGRPWQNFLKEIGTGQAAFWIMNGRISPWLLYITESGLELMSRFTDEQLTMVAESLDPILWEKRLAREAESVARCKAALEEAGV